MDDVLVQSLRCTVLYPWSLRWLLSGSTVWLPLQNARGAFVHALYPPPCENYYTIRSDLKVLSKCGEIFVARGWKKSGCKYLIGDLRSDFGVYRSLWMGTQECKCQHAPPISLNWSGSLISWHDFANWFWTKSADLCGYFRWEEKKNSQSNQNYYTSWLILFVAHLLFEEKSCQLMRDPL